MEPSIVSEVSCESLQDKVALVIAYSKLAGFETVDDLFSPYYTIDLDAMSNASEMRRISRGRRLAEVLRSIRTNVERWTEFESQAYRAEIYSTAEECYKGELRKVLSAKKLATSKDEEPCHVFQPGACDILRVEKHELQQQVSISVLS